MQEKIGGDCNIQFFREYRGLLRFRLQSRNVSSKSYLVWMKYDSDHVMVWYCRCRADARTIRTYSHVASVIWYFRQSIFLLDSYRVNDWGQYLDDAPEV